MERRFVTALWRKLMETLPQDGKYFVVVQESNNDQSIDYNLLLQCFGGQCNALSGSFRHYLWHPR